jgi:surface antigen
MRLGRDLWRGGTALLTSTLVATLLVVAGVQQQEPRPAPADSADTAPASGSTYLCEGYSGCRAAGYSDAGYGAVNNRMYWRMYSGHNCTNYAAYRMIKAGMPNERPWSGGGNASEWGLHMRDITDQRPAVGAIAWWGRYSNGSGSAGHVAYVERVVSSTEIVISEDSWGGTFHWRRLTKDSGRWPTGFIHFVDTKVVENVTPPEIEGTPQVGSALRANKGRWKPSAESFAFQWYADGAAIAGATAQGFTPTAEQAGKRLTVSVTAKRPGHTPATETSSSSAPVERGEFTVVSRPAISGEPLVDEVLTATPARFSPSVQPGLYRWIADGEVVAGVDGPRLELTRDLVGKKIQVSTPARSPGYRNLPVRSTTFGPVAVGRIEATAPPALSGTTRVGSTLTVTPGSVTPADVNRSYQWLRDGQRVPGATGTSYVLTGADLGAEISVAVTHSRRNYLSLVETAAAPASVTTRPTVGVAAVGKPGRAVVRVRVAAPGVDGLDGRVAVRVGARSVWVDVVDGRGMTVVDGVVPGRRTVRVRYDGTSTVEPGRATTSVRVPRR